MNNTHDNRNVSLDGSGWTAGSQTDCPLIMDDDPVADAAGAASIVLIVADNAVDGTNTLDSTFRVDDEDEPDDDEPDGADTSIAAPPDIDDEGRVAEAVPPGRRFCQSAAF